VIPDEAVEAAARAAFLLSDTGEEWGQIPERSRKRYREEVATVLDAAAPHMQDSADDDLTPEAKRLIALLILEAGGEVSISRRAIDELSDETVLESTREPLSGTWVIRAIAPSDKHLKYAGLDAISELGSDDPGEHFRKAAK
jgi:hypothetical protein